MKSLIVVILLSLALFFILCSYSTKSSTCPNPPTSTMEDEIDISTPEYTSIRDVPSAFSCEQLCVVDSKCMAWTWGKSTDPNENIRGVCYLKDTHGDRVPNPSVVSGFMSR